LALRIGILGGTFDPVHLGHIKISKAVMRKMKLDRIIFIPSFVSPHKQDAKPAGPADRLNMLKLALKDQRNFEVDEHEIQKEEISYSIDTIDYLKSKYPEDELFWIIGADMLFYIEKWHEYKKVLERIAFIAVGREGYDYMSMLEHISKLERKYNAHIFLCRIPNIDISSTAIRGMIREDRPVTGMLHPDTADYIKENSLYLE
jgi:nicotinate-nucleotide adenylyltransferase